MLKQLHLRQITLTLSLGHISDPETQQKIYDILVKPSMLSERKQLFDQLGINKLMTLDKYEKGYGSLEVVMSEFLKKTSVDFYLAELHGGFKMRLGLIKKNANKLWIVNMKDQSTKNLVLTHWEKHGVINWLIEKNEKNYRKLIAYKLERENEISTFMKNNPEFRSLERQIHELEAWQEAFADWFLDSGYELPKWGPEEGMLELKAETSTEEKDKTTKKKRKKKYNDEEMTDLYLDYINKTGDKNPIPERLAKQGGPCYSTWHRRLKRPSFQQLLDKKLEVLAENIVHLKAISAKKSPHIRREIPKSHKDNSLEELMEKGQISQNNPSEETENKIIDATSKIDEMNDEKCTKLLVAEGGYTTSDLKKVSLDDKRRVLKTLLKKE